MSHFLNCPWGSRFGDADGSGFGVDFVAGGLEFFGLFFEADAEGLVFGEAFFGGVFADVFGDFHGAKMGAAHGAEMGGFGAFLGEGFVVVFAGGFGIEP